MEYEMKEKNLYRINLSWISEFRIPLMGIATVGILLCHAVGRGVVMPDILTYVFNLGNYGVDMFLLLSGMSMHFSLKSRRYSLEKWYKKRYIKILLPFLMIAIPTYIVYCYVEKLGIWDFVMNITTLSYWTDHGSAWYVAMLLPLYLITPFFGKIIDKVRYRMVISVIIGVVFLILGSIPLQGKILANIQFVLIRIPSFVIGYGMANYIQEKKSVSILWIFGLGTLYFILAKLPYFNVLYRGSIVSIISIFILCIIFSKLKLEGMILKLASKLGNISYESYLTNIHLGYLLGLFPWKIGTVDLSKGNYLYYCTVVILGVILAKVINVLCNKIISALNRRRKRFEFVG